MKKIIIYTDGACRGNPGPGGWGALLCFNEHEKVISGAERDTTNNRMELIAAIKALQALKKSCKVELYTDSKYLQKGITEWMIEWKKRNWKKSDKKAVKNVDLWQALSHEVSRHDVSWHWVKGHSGQKENDRVDRIANEAIDQLMGKKK